MRLVGHAAQVPSEFVTEPKDAQTKAALPAAAESNELVHCVHVAASKACASPAPEKPQDVRPPSQWLLCVPFQMQLPL